MRRVWLIATVAPAALCAALGVSGEVRADWPMPRHDPRRSGVAEGLSNIVAPVPYWRFFQGGAIASTGATVLDCDADAARDVVFVYGGKVQCKRAADGSIVWETPLLAIEALVGVLDLDADAQAELVVRSSNRIFVLRPDDGTIVWAEPAGEMGTIGSVRAADLDGDGFLEIAIHECGCCSVNSGQSGFVYDFASGLASPTLRFTLPPVVCGGGAVFSVARIGAAATLVHGRSDGFNLIDGQDGAVLATLGGFGEYVQASKCTPVDLDGDGVEELGCVLSIALGPSGNGRRVYLLRQTPGGLVVAWQQVVGGVDGGIEVPAGWLGDLDGDGLLEMTLAAQTTPGTWSTWLYDAATGDELAVQTGLRARAIARLDTGGRPALVGEGGNGLLGFAFDRTAAPPLQLRWSLDQQQLRLWTDLVAASTGSLDQRAVSADLDGDGAHDLLTVRADVPNELTAYSFTQGMPTALASHILPVGIEPLAAWPLPGMSGEVSNIAVARSDGVLSLLDDNLLPQSSPALRFGGFYSLGSFRRLMSEPVVANLGGGEAAVLVPNSRGALDRLDTSEGTFASGPAVVWSRSDTLNPSVVAGIAAGAPGILALDTRVPERHTVLALDPSGAEVWTRELEGIAISDILTGDANGDAIPEIFVEWGEVNTFIGQWTALDGSNSVPLWTSTPYGPFNRQPSGGAAADWDGDGNVDVIYQAESTRVASGTDGNEIASGQPGYTYFMPIVADVDGDGVDEVTLNAGYHPARTLTHDLQSAVWIGQEDDRPFLYGAVVACADVPRLLTGSWQYPARLKRTVTSGPSAGSFDVVWLAGGKAFASQEEADIAGAFLGQLASPAVHGNLAGDGRPVAVLGSSDGWLYGVEACTGALRFSLDFGAPLGTVIFGDSDADGRDEIIVSAGDGYLYGLKQAPVAAPTVVIDTDPLEGIADTDVDEIWTYSTLYGSWDPIPGADGYEVAAVLSEDAGGAFLTNPPWTPVDLATTVALGNLPLQDGRRYHLAVRALAAGQPSPDRLSDGVMVHLVFPPPRGRVHEQEILNGRACLCALTGARGGAGLSPLMLAALGLGAAARRRTRCTRLHPVPTQQPR